MDPFHLDRFIAAQSDCYSEALEELRAGEKRTHWMWFVFPQLQGLGSSPTALRYAIKNLAEAQSYLAHPILGARLLECSDAVNAVQGRSALQIFGTPDDLKFNSCMTLFELASDGGQRVFSQALEKYYAGKRDERTLELIKEVGGQ